MKNKASHQDETSDSNYKNTFNSFLSGAAIKEDYFEGDATIRNSSLDMLPDCIIRDGEKIELSKNSSILINPQEMMIVVLKGKVIIPKNCIGIAYPKTALNQKGLHVLNTGIVDPGYNGYLSTIVMNYSNMPAEIRDSDTFLRLMLYKRETVFPNTSEVEITYKNYIDARIKDSEKYPKTFLDIDTQKSKIKNELSDEITGKAKEMATAAANKTGWTMGGIALILTIVIGLVSFFTQWASGEYIKPYDFSKQQLSVDVIKLQEDLAELTKQIDLLRNADKNKPNN